MKSANEHGRSGRRLQLVLSALLLSYGAAVSAAPLDSRANSKISSAKAKRWTGADQGPAINPAQQDKRIVNFGSRKNNTCNLNIGSTQPGGAKYGQRQSKEVIVTAKDVINICE